MEPAGLAIGIVGLAAVFNDALECFVYVQIGRAFGKDFQTAMIKLHNAELRLSRWGQGMGLHTVNSEADAEKVVSKFDEKVTDRDVEQAKRSLGQLMNLFTEAGKMAEKYETPSSEVAEARIGELCSGGTENYFTHPAPGIVTVQS